MTTQWDEETDVLVVGSGAAGCSAALAARTSGAEVLLLERTDKLGGTSAVSGGVPWIPNNHHMQEIGRSDSREQALTYLRRISLGKMDDVMIETFVDTAPQMLLFLEKETDLRFRALQMPDYHPEFPGGNIGRSVTAGIFPAGQLGELRPALRASAHFPIPISIADVEDGINVLDSEIIGGRLNEDMVGMGGALMAGLLKGALDHGVRIRRNVRVLRLVQEGDVVVGIEADNDGKPLRIGARKGVILACGGYEWNEDMTRQFLRGPMHGPHSPPWNEGDGLKMAIQAGASLGNMSEAWWQPSVTIPGEEYDGRPLVRLTGIERCGPGSIIVNRTGRRFVNEACNYNDIGRVFQAFDPVNFDYPNLPAWHIVSQDYMDRFPFLTRYPGDPVPSWMVSADTLAELAGKIGVDPAGLEAEVARFNDNARKGVDPDFHRGESVYELYWGDASAEGAAKTLGPLERGPYYAVETKIGTIGTKGGPRTNERAEVMSLSGGIVPGLYAAGNAMASIMGMAYPGGGATLGPALTFGHIAGREAARGSNRF
ncbi:FAD-dependent oxidoreductase [Sphingobium sp. Cam5-1]|uniref:FAD-dependent oxidoreductase n=1 Tax=Sphingobium sp. Cam5-1 TaxID=2789327 RepID=UPI0018AD1FFD|nr:FAD-dependent oxidoreductase [Sphingobium sp. Cam5-1]QPI74895.1 FAD-dependent oxidoreductase [Sphingobium sp. Cam5-1]